MDNFYKEHKGYQKLCKELEKVAIDLEGDLITIVGDAIRYGIDVCYKVIVKEKTRR